MFQYLPSSEDPGILKPASTSNQATEARLYGTIILQCLRVKESENHI